jgi:hypothetical protein
MWFLVVLSGLLVGHGALLYIATSHIALPVAVLSGAIILWFVTHRGRLRGLSRLLRHRTRNEP